LRKKKILLGNFMIAVSVLFSAGVFARWPTRAATGFSEFNQYLPQILVDYCASGKLIQPNDIARDSAVETGINDIRDGNGLPVLAHAAELSQAALRQSNDMAENSFVSHTGSDGSSVGERLEDACYQWLAYGEIIAMGYETPEDVIAGWMNSPAHEAAILSDLFSEFGAGYAYNPSGDDHYWTVDFGLRSTEFNLAAERYYSCEYYFGDEAGESWLSLNSIWPCDMEAQAATGLNGQR
jgi:uncharacterized protein YkwD